jgi:hypothetical protein
MMQDDAGEMSKMRISDTDRDWAASVLSDAVAEGRLSLDEHRERLNGVFAARTNADISPLINDLPRIRAAGRSSLNVPDRAPDDQPLKVSRSTRMISVFSGTERSGGWPVPSELDSINVFGATALDLREASLPAKELNIRVVCIFGGIEIKLPPDMQVIDSGFSFFGVKELPSGTGGSNFSKVSLLRLHGICIFGAIEVSRPSPRRR